MNAIDAHITPDRPALCRDPRNIPAFIDPALDFNPHDDEYRDLTAAQRADMATRKEQAEAKAVNVCFDCPLMQICDEIHLNAAQPVHGVVGGRTDAERRELRAEHNLTEPTLDDTAPLAPIDRGSRNQINDDIVTTMTAQGYTATQIADTMGCSARSVTRARKRAMNPSTRTAAPRAARTTTGPRPIRSNPSAATGHAPILSRVSPAMTAIYDHLATNEWVDRTTLIRVGMQHVADNEAHDWWLKKNSDTTVDGTHVIKPAKADTPYAKRITDGAYEKVANALSASARTRGHTERHPHDTNLYRMTDASRADWVAARSPLMDLQVA